MAGELSGCAARKKSKTRSSQSSSKNSDNGDQCSSKLQPPPQTTRGGLRVYKIVILGDGGVGKSGKKCFLFQF